MVSSSSSERYESASSITASQKHEKSRRRDRRSSPPTDTEDEDPFHFDNVLSPPSPTRNKAADGTRSTLSSSLLLRRASIVPVDPTAEPAPHRFSLLRERASEETIFVQEICDAEGRRWSLRVPASGLPEDMVHMLEELEKLAVELGQALPRIVVTCSAESLSLKRMERNDIVDSSELLRPPPAVADENLGGGDAGGGRSLAKEKRRLDGLGEKGQVSEEPTKPSETSSIRRSSASEQSLTCIYLPEVSPPSQTRFSSWHSHENRDVLQPRWRPNSCREVQRLQFCSPQTASTANQHRHRRSNAHVSTRSSLRSRSPNRRAGLPNVWYPAWPRSKPKAGWPPPPSAT